MTKLEKCSRHVNDAFSKTLAIHFHKKFNRQVDTRLILTSMNLVTEPTDGQPFTPEQLEWVRAWSDGYGEALSMIRTMAYQDSCR